MHPNNTEELLQSAEAWLQQAVNDLRQHIENFMRTEQVTIEDLANALALSVDEINAILEGNVDGVGLRTFAHVLIANGLALAIQPVVETPIHSFGGPQFGTQRRGFMPPPPPGFVHPAFAGGRQPMRRPMPGMGGHATQGQAIPQEPHAVDAPMAGQPRNSRGQFMSRQNVGAAMPQASDDPYLRLSIDALRDIITRNHWNYEIDINNSNRQELIEFLKNKERITIGGIPTENGQQRVQPKPQATVVDEDPKPVVEQKRETKADGPDVGAIANALAELFTSNPDAIKAFSSLLPKGKN